MDGLSAMNSAVSEESGMFMDLLLAQLQNQNPMEPMSNSEMVTQMAQLASVSGIRDLNDSFEDMLRMHMLVSGTELLGRQVEYRRDSAAASGVVESVSISGQEVKLLVEGQEISLDNVIRIL